ncbi:MAG: preprotein translocase subunit SecE [Candidatus Bipolaricaulia bacterium]
MLKRLKGFLLEVRSEVHKVSWPNRAEIISLTVLIVVLALILTLYIGGLDALFQQIIKILIG